MLTSKDCDSSQYFDNNKENNISDKPLNEELTDVYTTQANKGKVCGKLRLDNMSEIRRTFNNKTKNLGFNLKITTADLHILFAHHY